MPARPTATLWAQLFERSRVSGMSLQNQIRQMIVNAILSGHIAPDSALPSSRELADQLNVSRNTVVLAYQQLVEEGYLVSRERSGHFVNPATEELQRGFTATGVADTTSIETQQGHPDWSARIRHESILKASHSEVEKSPCVCSLPASSTTTSMPFCASSLASVPPPAPDPMTTTTLPSLCLNCTLFP